MPPTAKRRKTAAGAKHDLALFTGQQGIQAFGNISKPQPRLGGKNLPNLVSSAIVPNGKSVANKHKRQLQAIDTEDDHDTSSADDRLLSQYRKNAFTNPDAARVVAQEPLLKSRHPRTPHKKCRISPKIIETPTKGARSLFNSLALSSSSPSSAASSWNATSLDTPPSSPSSSNHGDPLHNAVDELPTELQDLVDLHSSFLTALSLHFTHNGSTMPADLRNLTPGIERAWKKRKILTEDIQKLLALENRDRLKGEAKENTLVLTGYGQGKICIELADVPQCSSTQRRPINEEELNAKFIRDLQEEWTSHKAAHLPHPSSTDFVSSLPLLTIVSCASLSKIAPLLSKGQRRLEDLKAGAIKAQKSEPKTTDTNAQSSHSQEEKQTRIRSTDLFSRLKAKQLHQSTLPLPPSQEALARKSALQRLPEVAAVLESLALSSTKHCNDDAGAETAGSRIAHTSFTMPTLIQHLQMSLRSPIAKEEAMLCVRLLAEIAPEWVEMRQVGKISSVTMRGSGVGRSRLGERIVAFSDRV